MGVTPVDRVEIHVLVDNATDSLSSIPPHAECEFEYLERHGMLELAGDHLCCACHGLSYLITAYRGETRRSHAGAMLGALDLIGGRSVPCYMHPGMFRIRARQLRNGRMLPSKDVPSVAALTERGGQVVCSTQAQSLLDDMFFLSGEIPRVTSFERGLGGHFARDSADDDWVPDPWLMDERWLGVHVAGKGLIVFTACSHAGVANVLHHARASFPHVRLYGLVGGLHLAGPNEPIISETVAEIGTFGLAAIAAGHCTGWRAIAALAVAFGDRAVDHAVVGKRYIL